MYLPLFVALPLIIAGILTCFDHRRVHETVLMAVLVGSLASGLALVSLVSDGSAFGHRVGMWPTGVAIGFAADMFTALMLVVTSVLAIACCWFGLVTGLTVSRYFAPLMLILMAGVNGALLTADMFNMFVFIEVMLLPSYGLFVLASPGAGTFRQVTGARLYVSINLLTSTIFVTGVAFLYGTAGTVNLGELAGQASSDPTVAIAGAICLFALGIKAAVFPVHGWLAQAYPSTSPAITALFSGLHTKVAIYAIYRVYAVLFDGDARFLWVGVVIFCATMVIGVLGAVGEKTTRSILAFHMVSQIGYILLGVALFTEFGLTAGIFYLLHHMIVKASLFLSTGAIEYTYGTSRIARLGGLAKKEPIIAATFFIAALSLAGIPPFSGFVAKFILIWASLDIGQIAAVVVMLLVSLVTLLSMLKIWGGVFWGEETIQVSTEDDRVPLRLAAPGMFLASITVILGLGAQLLLPLAETAALGLMDTSTYIEAVTR